MGARQSQEMRHAIYLYLYGGKSRSVAAAMAGVSLSGLCKALKDKPDKKDLPNLDNSTRVK